MLRDLPRIRAVFFDAGETLIAPAPSYGAVYERVTADFGMRIPAALFERALRDAWRAVPSPPRTSVTLEKIVTVGKTECLQLSGNVTCDKFRPPLPQGFTVEKSAVKISFAGKLPVANLLLPWESASGMTMSLTARGKPDALADEVVLQMSNERTLTEQATETK